MRVVPGAVELHRGDERAVVRDEEVAVHRREHADEKRRRNAEREPERHERARGRGLAVEQHRGEEEADREGPRRGLRHVAEAADDHLAVGVDEGVAQPGEAEDADDRGDAGLAGLALRHLADRGFGDRENERRDGEHDDGDGDRHRERLVRRARHRAQLRENAGEHDERDAREEDERARFRAFLERRQLGAGRLARRLDFAGGEQPLVLGIVLQFLAHAQLHERGDQHREQRGRHADEENLHQPDAMRREQADHRRRRRGDRARGDRLLRRDRGHGHRALRPDAVLVRHFVDHRQQRIDDVPGARREGEAIGDQRRDDRDLLRILADDLLRDAHEEVDRRPPLPSPTRP